MKEQITHELPDERISPGMAMLKLYQNENMLRLVVQPGVSRQCSRLFCSLLI